ncbi:ABC-type cobalamin/Fe3+-siderophores transport system ATPase subunit [Clostridium beijerinckii]|nr:ABC-type cobalamin/Fe3+-siderophores transport system ATPase subunit [Clostridium beijerinckii]
MEAISVKNLSVAYEDNLIIDNMNLSIPKGEISIIIGANGCGKSTLLKTIGRIIKPKNGEIFVNEKNIKKTKGKRNSNSGCLLASGANMSKWNYC